MAAVPVNSGAATRPWLFSPGLDLLVGCGAWSLPLLALTFFLQRQNAAAVAFAFYALAVFCNNPHYMATIYRAYHTPEDFRKYRFFTVYVTLLLVLTVVVVHLLPGLFPWVITLYLTWSPWHYTGQNFGIAQMLIRRAGASPDPVARHFLWFGYVASYAMWLLTLHAAREAGDPYFISLGVPERWAVPIQGVCGLAAIACIGAAFVRLARCHSLRSLLGPLVLTFTQLCWFAAPPLLVRFGGIELPASYFSAGALAFMHCAQYLWVTTYFARREDSPTKPFSAWRYYAILVIGGIALFVPGPWLASRLLRHDFVESFMIFMALVNLHHFILDGAIWKLRDGRIARLLLGRGDRTPDAIDQLAAPGASHLCWLFGTTRTARITQAAIVCLLVGIAALDQIQYFSTNPAAEKAGLDRAGAFNPHDPRPRFRRAQQFIAQGNLAEARQELERVVAANPRNAPAQQLLGQVLFQSNDHLAALTHYDRMFALFPNDLATAVNRGLLATSISDHPKTIESFERAVRLAPARNTLRAQLAAALASAGEVPRALGEYEIYLAAYEAAPDLNGLPDFLKASLHSSELLISTGEDQRAMERLQHVADLAATHHHFSTAAIALTSLAELQQKHGHAAAAKTRELAKAANRFAREAAFSETSKSERRN